MAVTYVSSNGIGFNPQYTGPEAFVSPLAFVCARCDRITEIIDTDRHGYHGEMDCAAVYRGEGPRQPFCCPVCGKQWFSLVVTFVYWDATFDLTTDEPEIPLEDYFNGFQAHGTCVGCGRVSLIAGFDL
jgi:hypothetical protein